MAGVMLGPAVSLLQIADSLRSLLWAARSFRCCCCVSNGGGTDKFIFGSCIVGKQLQADDHVFVVVS